MRGSWLGRTVPSSWHSSLSQTRWLLCSA